MKNGKDKATGDEPKIIRPTFGASKKNDTFINKQIVDNVRAVSDLIHEDLARPATLSPGSSIPPRSPEATAQVIKFKRASRPTKRTVFANRSKVPAKKRETFDANAWLMREKAAPTIESIAGGVRQQINPENMAEEDARAQQMGYAGVRKVYLTIKNTIPQADVTDEENADYESRMSERAEKIAKAVQELENFYNFRDKDGEPVFTDDPRDPRLFNAVASILIGVWGHNYLTKLNDLRVNTIVLLLNRGDVSWKKLIDLMVEWEKSPSVARTVNRYYR